MKQQATNLALGLQNHFEKKVYMKSDSWPVLKSKGLFQKIPKDSARLRFQKIYQSARISTILPFIPTEEQKNMIRKIVSAYNESNNLVISTPFKMGSTHILLSTLIGSINEVRQEAESDSFEMPSRIIYVASSVKRLEAVAATLKNLVYRPSVGVILPKEISCNRYRNVTDAEVMLIFCNERNILFKIILFYYFR